MYTSIDKLDIVFDDPQVGTVGVQTDHRDPAEIVATWDLSVLLAAIRRINAWRVVPELSRLRFSFVGDPEPRFAAWLRSIGVDVEGPIGTLLPALANDPDALWETINRSVCTLGEQIFSRYGHLPDAHGLGEVVSELSSAVADVDDETCLWTGVLEIGAATFVALRAMRPGLRLVADPSGELMIPFVATVEGTQIHVFSKAERYVRQGRRESPVQLLLLMADAASTEGPLMFNLRPPDWAGRDRALTLPLFGSSPDRISQAATDALPILSLCRDRPNSVATLPVDTPEDEVAAGRAEAERNLARVVVQVQKLGGGPGEIELRIVHGDYYAAEKVFDSAFMSNLAKELGSPVLTVSLPRKGQLLVAAAFGSLPEAAAFRAVTERAYYDAPPSEQLSKQMFGWFDGSLGALVNLVPATPDASNAPPDPEGSSD